MKNVLIYSVCEDFNSLEYAIENVEAGNNVYLIECDKKQENCQHNRLGSRLTCAYCYYSMCGVIKRCGLRNKTHFMRLSDIIEPEDEKTADAVKVDFNNVQELKNLTHKGAQLGYGAFSSYCTFSRNVMPEITEEFKKYIRSLFKTEVMIFEALERLNKKIGFDLIIFHNGRFSQFKPFLEFARLHGINYIATEVAIRDGRWLRNDFYNDVPHSIKAIAQKVKENWDEADPKKREAIGRSFYERRKKGLAAGDKVFVKDQHIGEMPEEWSDDVENISIFNSSEDEFCAVSKEYDSYLMFPNQFVALKTIFDHYKDDKTKHFYVRIHPNLKNVPFKSHLALHELKYDNVTIIPADSTISSYTLLDNSDKIIIFDSTMGVEAAYWGKPVIALSKYVYYELDLLYHPNTPDEIWPLIDNKNLPAKTNDNLIKYGYWLLHPDLPEPTKVPYKYVTDKVLGHPLMRPTIMKAFGSYKTHIVFKRLLDKAHIFTEFDNLPCTESYKGKE